MVEVKICGLSEPDTLQAAVAAGADQIGFNFFPPSPRSVDLDLAARLLAFTGAATPVAVLVDPSDEDVEAVAELGFPVLQLHGRETPQRALEVKERTGLKVWKAFGVSTAVDLQGCAAFDAVDRLLLDAKPPAGADMPGGQGAVFDWNVVSGWTAPKPWILSGGLTSGNVATAIARTGALAVDVSSGVERQRGVKDAALIEAFIAAAKAA